MTILITGGAKRLGRFLAINLAKSGHKLVITYNSTKQDELAELQALGIICLKADLTQTQNIASLVETIAEVASDLTCIIHNAALWLPNSSNIQTQMADFQTMFNLHMQAPFALNMALAPILKNNAKINASNIIHLTDAVVNKAAKNHIAYAATKAGLQHLTKSFALNFAPFIRVNSIAPALLEFNSHDSQEYKIKAQKKALLKVAQGFDVALQAVEYLLKNQYVTGTCLVLDGGRSCL